MKDDKKTKTPPITSQQETPPAKAAAPVRQYAYQGPMYTRGIFLHDVRRLVKPLNFSDEEVEDFVKKYPFRRNWWKGWDK